MNKLHNANIELFENSQKASRTAQNALAGRVFETPVLDLVTWLRAHLVVTYRAIEFS